MPRRLGEYGVLRPHRSATEHGPFGRFLRQFPLCEVSQESEAVGRFGGESPSGFTVGGEFACEIGRE
jgi:hypothetical protein